MLRTIKFIASVLFGLVMFLVVESAVTIVHPHESVEAKQYEQTLQELDADAETLAVFVAANGR